MVVNRQLRAPGVCELVAVVFLGVELKVKAVVEEFLEVVCMGLVVGAIESVVVVGGFFPCHLLQGCVGVGCELSHLCLE